MPIKIPNDLPASATLSREGVALIREDDAIRQDIRPLRVALLNLMPQKIKTETQFARLIAATPMQVEMTLLRVSSHRPKTTPFEHMLAFYRPWEDVAREKFDAMIVTGAPVELLDFEDVSYWEELCAIFDWTQTHVHSTLNVCWGAQAALHHFHGVPKHALGAKMFGVYRHRVLEPTSPLLRGFNDDFAIPISRHTEVRRADLPDDAGLRVLCEAEEAGLCLIEDPRRRHIHMFNHVEYDSGTLGEEYARDVAAGREIAPPRDYYPDDDPERAPVNTWRAPAHLFFGNWVNEVYQTTPYDLSLIGADDLYRAAV